MARSGGGLGGSVGFSDIIVDTGKFAVRILEHILGRDYVSGGSWTVLDSFVSVPADSEENEDSGALQSDGSCAESAVYEYMPEKPGTAGPSFSAICPADSADSGAPGFFFSFRPYLRFFCGGCRLFFGISGERALAPRGASVGFGGSDQFFQAVPGRPFSYGRSGGMSGRMRCRDWGILRGSESGETPENGRITGKRKFVCGFQEKRCYE